MASTVFVATEDSTAVGGEDYVSIPDLNSTESFDEQMEIKFGGLDTKKEFTVKTYADEEQEGTESFYVGLFKSLGAMNSYIETGDESQIHTYLDAYMKDPSQIGSYDYTVTTDSPSGSSAKSEGEDITVTITRSVSGSFVGESEIYFNTTPGSADETDYVSQKAIPVKFTSNEERYRLEP